VKIASKVNNHSEADRLLDRDAERSFTAFSFEMLRDLERDSRFRIGDLDLESRGDFDLDFRPAEIDLDLDRDDLPTFRPREPDLSRLRPADTDRLRE